MKSNVDVKYVLINRDGEEIVSRANFNWSTGVVTSKEEISEELLTTVIDEKIMIENSVLELDMSHLSETGERKEKGYVLRLYWNYF